MTTDAEVKGMEVISDSETPSEPEQKPSPEMLTKEQAEKLANEKHSKLDKKIAELTKAQMAFENRANEADVRATKAQKALNEAVAKLEDAERKSLGDKPEAIALFEERVKQRQKDADLAEREARIAQREADNAEKIARAEKYEISERAKVIATEYGVSADLLISLTDGSQEKMEILAKSLPKKDGETPPKPDSGKSSSGKGRLTLKQLEDLDMDKYKEMVEERDKRK